MAFLQFDECELMIRHVAVFVASFSHDRSRHHVSRGEIRRVICAQEGQKRPGGTRRVIGSYLRTTNPYVGISTNSTTGPKLQSSETRDRLPYANHATRKTKFLSSIVCHLVLEASSSSMPSPSRKKSPRALTSYCSSRCVSS